MGPRRRRRRATAALSGLRHDGRRGRCAVPQVLGGNDVFRAAVVRSVRVGQSVITEPERKQAIDCQCHVPIGIIVGMAIFHGTLEELK